MIRQLPAFVCGLFFALTLIFGSQNLLAAEDGHGVHADVTHGHSTSQELNNLLELKSSKSFFSAIVFLILCCVLYVLAWKPIATGLEKREKMIATQIHEAKVASENAAAMLKEYEAKLADAAVQAQELVFQARKDAEAVADRIKGEAQSEASRLRDRALSEIESAKQAALADLTNKSTDIAFALARRVVGRELKAEDHQRLIADAIGNLSSKN